MPRDIKEWVGGQKLSNFDYSDIVSGKSYVHQYAGFGNSGTNMGNILIGSTFYSKSVFTTVNPATTQVFEFNSPVTSTSVVDGDAIISVTVNKTAKSTPSSSCDVSGALLRIRNGEVTRMGEGQLRTVTTGAAAGSYRCTDNKALTKTRLKNGDTLRLQLKVTVAGSNDTYEVYHDPKNRDGNLSPADNGSTLDVYLPFNVNL